MCIFIWCSDPLNNVYLYLVLDPLKNAYLYLVLGPLNNVYLYLVPPEYFEFVFLVPK